MKLGAAGEFFAPGGAENLRILRGRISSFGTLLDGAGFTSSKIATGHYLITFTTAFVGIPTVTVTVVEFASTKIATISAASTTVDVFTKSLGGAALEAEFHIIIIGAR